MSNLTILGDHPFAKDGTGKLRCRIATIFVPAGVLVTLPGIHATQRLAYTSWLNDRRKAEGRPQLTAQEEGRAWQEAADLIIDNDHILIRPDPANMPLAFEADRLLQELPGLSKRNIRFLYAREEHVQKALRQRGEYWRITPLPQSPEEIAGMIERSRIGIEGEPIYHYSMVTGTRYLTLGQFAALGAMDDASLRGHLREIAEYAGRINRLGHRELEFFAAGRRFAWETAGDIDWERAGADELRAKHREFERRFRSLVPEELREETPGNLVWRNRMFSALIGQRDETISEEVVRGINPEFFMQIRWLPGGRIEHGELMFDSVFSEAEEQGQDPDGCGLCDENVKGFICNYVREFGNLDYVNIGQVAPSIRSHERVGGHRAYIAEVKHRGSPRTVVRILRVQKWGIREHLDEGKDLLRSIIEAEEYTDYILDRRLGCWQLGMPLPGTILTRRIVETYRGPARRYDGTRIWTTYFERDYIRGVATDKIPAALCRDERFALALARLLGRAAAPNMAVGRATLTGHVIFDDGDEILVTDRNGMPRKIIVADHAGTFNDCESPLDRFAPGYALPVLSRRDVVPDAGAFRDAYLAVLGERLEHLQREYRRHRRGFDTLFKHSKQGVGAFAWRWQKALARLDQTHVPSLLAGIRSLCGIPG